MKIALLGYGKMGRAVVKVAKTKGHQIISCIDPFCGDATHSKIDQNSIEDADVVIDFTHPESTMQNIETVAKLQKNMVIGTTGWYEKIDEVKKLVQENQIGLLYASNFSLGVNLFLQIVEKAASLIEPFEEYDVAGFEAHHNRKVDSPSGTAISITETLLQNFKRKKSAVFETINRQIKEEELHFPSLRLGSIPGGHSVVFDSDADTISLKHEARSRKGFAKGAVLAAEWIYGKKGLYEMKDLIRDLTTEEVVK